MAVWRNTSASASGLHPGWAGLRNQILNHWERTLVDVSAQGTGSVPRSPGSAGSNQNPPVVFARHANIAQAPRCPTAEQRISNRAQLPGYGTSMKCNHMRQRQRNCFKQPPTDSLQATPKEKPRYLFDSGDSLYSLVGRTRFELVTNGLKVRTPWISLDPAELQKNHNYLILLNYNTDSV